MLFLGILGALIASILVNEFMFDGSLFSSEHVGRIGGLAVLAAAIGARVAWRYRGQRSHILRNVTIWLAVLTALVFGYWLFGNP